MSIVRSVDGNNDWKFGKGKNDYKRDLDAVTQNIKTRLQSFLGDCFFAVQDGVDWFTLLGGKSKAAVSLAISSTILNTEGVTSLVELNLEVTASRDLLVNYTVTTVYSTQTLGTQVELALPVV